MGWTFFDDSLSLQWDHLVKNNLHGRFIHLLGFKKAVEHGYGLRPIYLAYLEKGEILSLFPGFFHRSWLLGKKIVSQPFSEYGGLLFRSDISSDKKLIIIDQFLKMIKNILAEKNYLALEMRHPQDILEIKVEGLQAKKLFRRSWLELQAPKIFWTRLDPKERNVLRKAQSYGLKSELASDWESLQGKFYPLYLRTMKRLGSPPHPLIYFRGLHHHLQSYLKIFIISFKTRPVASLLAWAVGQTVHITDMVSDERFFFVKPNDWAIWEFLNWAYHEGFKTFDFGPVRYRGQEIFKKKWLLSLEDYYYVYAGTNLQKVRNIFFQNSFLTQMAPVIWKSLLPQPMTALSGKYFRKEIAL